MTFANPLPFWALALAAGGLALVAWLAYNRVPMPANRRLALSSLRFLTLTWLLVCLLRPMVRAGSETSDALVPILVDASRSMGLADQEGATRMQRAQAIVSNELLPALSRRFHAEVLRFGDHVAEATPGSMSPTDVRTDLASALRDVRDRYRGRPIAGIVLVSDGGDNGDEDAVAAASAGPPIFALGLGARRSARDREVTSITAAESVLTGASVDVAVSAVAYGDGSAPLELRLLENGRQVDVERVTPAADGVPVTAIFHVAPDRDVPTIYTAEVPAAPGELAAENNRRSVLVPAARRPRRVLLVEGAPGFEHAFLKRAWSADAGLEVDAVVRKGRDDSGADTFYAQAPADRANALLGGFPNTREALFAYDVVVLANVDADELTAKQLELARAFVSERGGGLLLLGARGFQRQELRDTPIEDVLPLDLADRSGGVVQASVSPGANRVALTAAGEAHPMMQLAATSEENDRRWSQVPSLASVAPLGAARPGASVLAVTGGPGGAARALVAVQTYGAGRAMIFTGEASWRWRMLEPASDATYDRFWRQAIRWLCQEAPDAIAMDLPPAGASSSGRVQVIVDARDAAFTPQADATVVVRLVAADGRAVAARAEPLAAQPGRYRAVLHAPGAGVYHVSADASRGSTSLGTASGSVLVGGVDPEMTDPRLHLDELQRVAEASRGGLIADGAVAPALDRLAAAAPSAALALRRDLWHTGWSFALIAALLAAEWLTRRRWGLR